MSLSLWGYVIKGQISKDSWALLCSILRDNLSSMTNTFSACQGICRASARAIWTPETASLVLYKARLPWHFIDMTERRIIHHSWYWAECLQTEFLLYWWGFRKKLIDLGVFANLYEEKNLQSHMQLYFWQTILNMARVKNTNSKPHMKKMKTSGRDQAPLFPPCMCQRKIIPHNFQCLKPKLKAKTKTKNKNLGWKKFIKEIPAFYSVFSKGLFLTDFLKIKYLL